jgi:hypothetical protein
MPGAELWIASSFAPALCCGKAQMPSRYEKSRVCSGNVDVDPFLKTHDDQFRSFVMETEPR